MSCRPAALQGDLGLRFKIKTKIRFTYSSGLGYSSVINNTKYYMNAHTNKSSTSECLQYFETC